MLKKQIFFLLISICYLLAACSNSPSKNEEPTQPAISISTDSPSSTLAIKKTETTIVQQHYASEVNEAEIAIIQHYTLLSYHFYPEAYQFLSQKKSGGQQSYENG
jgi:uncharacterized protein YcfL